MKARGIIKRAQVEIIITTDDPVDNLELHKKLAVDMSFKTKVLPGWSPVAAMDINSVGFMNYVKRLGVAAGFLIENFSDMKIALSNRMKFFSANGCRSCEHSMERLTYMPAADKQISEIFAKRLEGDTLTVEEVDRYQYALLSSCAKEYARLGWVMQLYIGALRNVNSDMLGKLGQDTGFDSVDPTSSLAGLPEFLNDLNLTGLLPKTLIFPIDSKDNLAISTLTGCFTQEGIKGIVQQGSSWWFNDTYTGLKRQILNFAEQGILANFIGMLADSKSFLSYTRHEYFRRILCNIIGGWVDNGLYPADMDHLGSIVRDICYNNAKAFFNL
jgi:glucuronate isomerase